MDKRPARPEPLARPPEGSAKAGTGGPAATRPTSQPASPSRPASASENSPVIEDTSLAGNRTDDTNLETAEFVLGNEAPTRKGGSSQRMSQPAGKPPQAAGKNPAPAASNTPHLAKSSTAAGAAKQQPGPGGPGKTNQKPTEAATQIQTGQGTDPPGKTGSKTDHPEKTASTGGATTAAAQKVNVIGDYKLLKKLGAGGMGAVYKAHQISLDREVALKLLSRELASKPAFVERFKREARVMARMDHPNILRCFDVGEANGWHYLAMEFVDGGSVEGWLKKLGKFSVEDALYIVLCCARGLQHAHENTLVHRDIKPDNILLTSKGVVKIADLGLAKATDEDMSLTRTGTGAGTPLFMAPEQARDVKHVDGRVDIYALGCMLFCLLTGEHPFKGETLVEVIDAKTKGKFTRPRQLNPDIPPRLELIIEKMIQAKPEHRFQTCAEVIQAIEELQLAGDRLSFIGAVPTETASKSSGAPAVPTSLPTSSSGQTRVRGGAAATGIAATGMAEAPARPDVWYVKLQLKGKVVTKRVTLEVLQGLLRNGAIGPETELSHNSTTNFRPLGTYKQFEALVRAKEIQDRANQKGKKYRELYEQIEQEDEERRRWKEFHTFLWEGGGLLGSLIRYTLLFALLAGLAWAGLLIYQEWGAKMGNVL